MTDSRRESGLVRVLGLDSIRPSPENDRLYRSVQEHDPKIAELAASIRDEGLLEPLVVTSDGWIVSGHRRFAACRLARLAEVTCHVLPNSRADFDDEEFLRLLREHNRSREKSFEETFAEALVDADPAKAYTTLLARRKPKFDAEPLAIEGAKRRHGISKLKRPFADRVVDIVHGLREWWPLSVRTVHYQIVTGPPVSRGQRRTGNYRNDEKSSKDLSDLLVRLRVQGEVPWEAIDDETRPFEMEYGFNSAADFVSYEINDLFSRYSRRLMQSQPAFTVVLVEKNTVMNVARRVADQFRMPVISGRGFESISVRWKLLREFVRSGKDSLCIIAFTDYDPDGVEMPHSIGNSLRDDFGMDESQLSVFRCGVTPEQVAELDEPPAPLDAKTTSSRYEPFLRRTGGTTAFELEALPPADLERVMIAGIDSCIDVEAFNREREQERDDATRIEAMKRCAVDDLLLLARELSA